MTHAAAAGDALTAIGRLAYFTSRPQGEHDLPPLTTRSRSPDARAMPLESPRRAHRSSSAQSMVVAVRPWVVVFYPVAEFPMMAFAAAIEPLRAANRLSGVAHFEWRLYSRDGRPVRASNGIDVAVAGALPDARGL